MEPYNMDHILETRDADPFPAPPTLTPLFPSRFFAVELYGRLDWPQERYSY